MNCMHFQRELNADPRGLSAAALSHAETCPDCARRLASQLAHDARWAAGLAVEPPPGLADRILLTTRLGQRKRRQAYSMAASLAAGVAVALGLNLVDTSQRPHDLATIAAEHVVAEPEHLAETRVVKAATLERLLARVGARMDGGLPATYANACVLPNGTGGHIVLATSHGRVTLMLMPSGKTDTVTRRAVGNLIVEVSAARHGSYSLVASSEAALSEAKALLARHLKWS